MVCVSSIKHRGFAGGKGDGKNTRNINSRALQLLMLNQIDALEIGFKSLFIIWGFLLLCFCSRVDNPHEMLHMARCKKENSFNIKAIWLQKVPYLFLWHSNKLTHEKIKRKSIVFESSFDPKTIRMCSVRDDFV